jgi:thiamine-phosphate pyrophosphorylase
MHGLYPIVDIDTLAACGISAADFTREVLTVRPALLQLRAKSATSRELLALARLLKGPCAEANTLLFLNDRVDLAMVAQCDGVHVGQQDLPVGEVRRVAPNLQVGVSTHDLDQLETALAEAPDYVALGPVYATTSKLHPDPVVGLELLAVAADRARSRSCPLVAIGGIDVDRATAIAEVGAVGAVIGGLLPEEGLAGVARRAAQLHRLLGGRE